jgi:hypothetical protein
MNIIIRAIKDRKDYIEYLNTNLPYANWCFDQKHDAMDTFLRAMRLAGEKPTIHMEEDVILTQDFMTKILTVISEHPNEVIQFFSMRKDDLTVGSRYDRNYMMNQCFYLPAGYSRIIGDFYTIWEGKKEHPTGTDTMINDFLKLRKEKYWLHVPSLVQHRECVSMIDKRRSSKRQSKTFADPI